MKMSFQYTDNPDGEVNFEMYSCLERERTEPHKGRATCQDVEMSKCPNVELWKCQDVELSRFKIVAFMSKCWAIAKCRVV